MAGYSVLMAFVLVMGVTSLPVLTGSRRSDGLLTIAEVLNPEGGLDDGAIYHPEVNCCQRTFQG